MAILTEQHSSEVVHIETGKVYNSIVGKVSLRLHYDSLNVTTFKLTQKGSFFTRARGNNVVGRVGVSHSVVKEVTSVTGRQSLLIIIT